MATRPTLSSSRWSARDARRAAAAASPPELGLRLYGARLLGSDPALVLAGGGNSSVKATVADVHGAPVEALFVKGSGADLATVTARDFVALELAPLRRLLELPALADAALVRELGRARLDPAAPRPSVETLLHALLPHRFVDHAHPDATLALVASREGARRAEELWGEDCLIVPYVPPGFELARRCAALWRAAAAAGRTPRGIVLLHHGLVAFADEARASYETLLELDARAARRLPRPRGAARKGALPAPLDALATARLRRALSHAAGRPLVVVRRDEREARRYAARADVARVSQRGPLTPDHLLRTRRLPLVLTPRDLAEVDAAVERYAAARRDEFERRRGARPLVPLDPAPRVVVVPGTGLLAAGETAGAAATAGELAARTAWAIARAEALGGYRPLPAAALFEFEHWAPERAKLAAPTAPLAGRVALVTGSAGGIGRAAAAALLAQGAAVVGVDLRATELAGDFRAVTGDAASPRLLRRAIELAVESFGGLDIVVSNVGIFFAGPKIEALRDEDWRRTMALNADAHLALLRAAIPFLRLAPAGGAVVVVGSKNVRAPGPGAAAYSASKAALTQLARVAALELAGDGIRVNVVHPDAVFDTGVWTPERLAERARNYGLSVADYRRRNLLRREVAAADVGALVAALAGDLFAKTTGAQIPVDGGNERVV